MKNNRIILLLGLLGFIVMADNWVVSPILPAIAQNLGIPVENAGILISAYMIPFGIFQIIFGQMAIGTFMGISFLGQGLSMITGGAISYFLNWRGVFVVYAILALIPMALMIKNYKEIPDTRNPDSQFIKPYFTLLSNPKSLNTYILVILEGLFIISSFSYLGAYISQTYHYNYLVIGAIMTAFGFMSLVGGRLGGKLVPKTVPRKILTAGLIFALAADLMIWFAGQNLAVLIISVGLLGVGFIFTHSTLLTRATQFADKARGAAMSLVAFCFMGGGGVGTALGGKIASTYGFSSLFLIYGLMLFVTLAASFLLVKDNGLQVAAPQTGSAG